MTMQHHLKTSHTERFGAAAPFNLRFNVVTHGDRILPTHNVGVRRRATRLLNTRDVQIHLDQRVIKVESGALVTDRDDRIEFDALIWVTNASAPDWMKVSALTTNDDGFILIDRTLRSTSHKDIFATGDIATLEEFPRPKIDQLCRFTLCGYGLRNMI